MNDKEHEHGKNGKGTGSGGECVCRGCGQPVPHKNGVRCRDMKCPACGSAMSRHGSHSHE